MVKIFLQTALEPAAAFPAHPQLPGFSPAQCRTQHADAHVVAIQDGVIAARCSLWWTLAPTLPGQRLGIIGHFATVSAAAARELLAAACAELRRRGLTLAVGPMDGTTWRRYRLLTERGTEPPFFLEPDNPDDWPECFLSAGFAPRAGYFSALNDHLDVEDPRIPRTVARLERSGVKFRAMQPESFLAELRNIYAVSRVSFQNNFLYTPVDEADFVAQYEPIHALIRPELVIFAEHEGRTVGFVFGIPNLAQVQRGQAIDTVVVKTVAVLPGRTYAGLGNVLVAHCQQAARKLGFRRVIHALMHESNNSLNLSGHYAKPFRRYTLYSHPL
jgi:GNAT superfamily N-acetyltransferase